MKLNQSVVSQFLSRVSFGCLDDTPLRKTATKQGSFGSEP